MAFVKVFHTERMQMQYTNLILLDYLIMMTKCHNVPIYYELGSIILLSSVFSGFVCSNLL